MERVGTSQLEIEIPCRFCVDGVAKWICIDCNEVLPCCKCFDQGGFRGHVRGAAYAGNSLQQ